MAQRKANPNKLTIYLLGHVQFCLDDGPPLPLEAGKASALLVYLAVEAAHSHARQTLAELLWPERADAEALGALRFALSNLRAVLHDRQASPPFLRVSRSSVQLNLEAEIWIDVAAFQNQAAACEAENRQGAVPPPETLQAALALYRGPFLQGFNLGDSLDFESWALRTRERLERQHLRLLHFLGTAQEVAGDHVQAAETYRTILHAQPWSEDAHQSVMRALAAGGQYGAALAQYEVCRRALDELGIEPGGDTNALYQRIKQEASGASTEPVAAPFVARERELARLTAFLERTLAGQGQAVLIAGEAGSGKTALLSAFARQALVRHPDLLVAGGRCDAYAGEGQPYQPFVESVRTLAGDVETAAWADWLDAESRERLAQALPQIAQMLTETAPDLLDRVVNRAGLARRIQDRRAQTPPLAAWQKTLRQDSPPAPAGLETGRLFKQLSVFLAALARQRPLVLLLDDLQWIDAGGAALLFHLARHLARSRVLIVAAYRPGEINRREETGQHPLLGVITELQHYGGDIRIDLDQVDEQAFVTAFLNQDPLLHPNRLDETFRAALARRTGGNPLFTTELLRSLQTQGQIRRAEDGSWVSSPTLDWECLPERVEAAIAGRVAQLPDPWRDWLSTASVEGESFTAEVLARVHGVDNATLCKALSGPLGMGRGARRLVQGEGPRWVGVGDRSCPLSRYRFRHILFQVYLYQQLDPAERARQHAAVGFALEDLYDGQPQECALAWRPLPHAAELARHFEAGGLPEKAAAYHLQAGRRAVYLASPQAAVAHYRRGLALLADRPHTPARDRLEIHLHLALGAPFLRASGWGGPERQEAIQRAWELLQATGQADHPLEAEWDELLLALYAQSDWLISQGEPAPAIRLAEQILALSGPEASLPQALARRILGLSYMFQGHFPEARRQLDDALVVYQAIGRPATLAQIGSDLEVTCRALLGFVLAVSGHLDQAWEQIFRAISRARRVAPQSFLGMALILACEVAVLRGDLPALHALAGELLQVGQTPDMQFFLAYGWAAEGHVQALQAKPGSEQAQANLELIRRGMRLWQSTGVQAGSGVWIVRLADACLQAGEIAAGLAITSSALAAPDQVGIAAGLARIYRLHGELLLRQEPPDRSAAEACFYQALDVARHQGAHTLELRAAISLARLWQAEKPEAARRLLADTYAWFTEGLDTPDLQQAVALLAE